MGKLGTSFDVDTSFGQTESTGRYLVSNNARFGRSEIDTTTRKNRPDPEGLGRIRCQECNEWFFPTKTETEESKRVQNKRTHNRCAYRYQLRRARERAAKRKDEMTAMEMAMERES